MEALLFCLFKKNLKAINDLAVGKSFSKIHYKFAFGLNFNFAMELENFPINSVFIIYIFLLRDVLP